MSLEAMTGHAAAPARHELCVELSPRPSWVWAAAVLGFLALPKIAATADKSILKMTNYYAAPSGTYDSLTVTGETLLDARGVKNAQIQLLSAGSTDTLRVGVGTTSPERMFHVAGNVQISGCFHLGWNPKTKGPNNSRCKWN